MYRGSVGRTLASLVLMLCVTIYVTSCARNTGIPARVEIEFMNWEGTPEGARMMKKLIDEFEKAHPSIKVRNVFVPQDAAELYSTKLLTRFGSGTPPDVFEMQAEMIHPFLRKHVLLDLTPYLKKSKAVDLQDFFPVSLLNFMYDGRNFRQGGIYGLPKDIGTYALVYNKDLFDAAGLAYPTGSWTHEQYLSAAERLTKRDSSGRVTQYGIGRLSDPMDWMLNMGARPWSHDYSRCLLGDKASTQAYQLRYDLQMVRRVAISQLNFDQQSAQATGFGFASGKCGMSDVARYELPDTIRNIGHRFRWGVAPLPTINATRKRYLRGPSGWSISATTRYPDACFKFVEFLVGKTGQMETAKVGWNIPSDKEVAHSSAFLEDLNRPDSEQINTVYLEGLDDLDPALLNPHIPMGRVAVILDRYLSPAVVKNQGDSVKQGLERARAEIQREIDRDIGVKHGER